VDEHFRVMSNFCGMRHISYEWIRVEELAKGMTRLVEQMQIQDDPEVQQAWYNRGDVAGVREQDDEAG